GDGCRICGAPLAYRAKKYCSRVCLSVGMTQPKRPCERCGEPILGAGKKYCSMLCRSPEAEARRHKTCPVCATPVSVRRTVRTGVSAVSFQRSGTLCCNTSLPG